MAQGYQPFSHCPSMHIVVHDLSSLCSECFLAFVDFNIKNHVNEAFGFIFSDMIEVAPMDSRLHAISTLITLLYRTVAFRGDAIVPVLVGGFVVKKHLATDASFSDDFLWMKSGVCVGRSKASMRGTSNGDSDSNDFLADKNNSSLQLITERASSSFINWLLISIPTESL